MDKVKVTSGSLDTHASLDRSEGEKRVSSERLHYSDTKMSPNGAAAYKCSYIEECVALTAVGHGRWLVKGKSEAKKSVDTFTCD